MSNLYDYEVLDASGQSRSLADFKGKVLLLVNVASACGYTPQYEGLEQLYRQYKGQGFEVIAFPCNDFGAQEPGTMEEIQQFCQTKYNATFEIMNKVNIIGKDAHPLYQWLTSSFDPAGDVKWNFEKFLISRDGHIIGRFPSKVKPEDKELTDPLEQALV